MTDPETENRNQDNPPKENDATPSPAAAKPTLSLAKLTSRFADSSSKPQTPRVHGPSYADQIADKSPLVTKVSELDQPPTKESKPQKSKRLTSKPFSAYRNEETGKRITIQLPLPVDIALRVHAASGGNAPTHIIETAIEDYFKKHGIVISSTD